MQRINTRAVHLNNLYWYKCHDIKMMACIFYCHTFLCICIGSVNSIPESWFPCSNIHRINLNESRFNLFSSKSKKNTLQTKHSGSKPNVSILRMSNWCNAPTKWLLYINVLAHAFVEMYIIELSRSLPLGVLVDELMRQKENWTGTLTRNEIR